MQGFPRPRKREPEVTDCQRSRAMSEKDQVGKITARIMTFINDSLRSGVACPRVKDFGPQPQNIDVCANSTMICTEFARAIGTVLAYPQKNLH